MIQRIHEVPADLPNKNKHYADQLRELANMVEDSPSTPVGFYVQVYWPGNLPTTIFAATDDAINLMEVVGTLEVVKQEIIKRTTYTPLRPGPTGGDHE